MCGLTYKCCDSALFTGDLFVRPDIHCFPKPMHVFYVTNICALILAGNREVGEGVGYRVAGILSARLPDPG